MSLAEAQRLFDSQLSAFKQALVPKYRAKAKLTAERESLRFQYLTGIRVQLQSLYAAMYNRVYDLKNGDAENLLRTMLVFIQGLIPMVNLQGGPVQGWGGQLFNFGGKNGLGLLSPTEHWLSLPMTDESPDKGYQAINLDSYIGSAEKVVDDYFLRIWQGAWMNIYFPVSNQFILDWLNGQRMPQLDVWSVQVPAVVDILNGDYSGVTLAKVLSDARNLLIQIVEKTKTLVQMQLDIDTVETQLADFVAVMKEQIPNLSALDKILSDIQAEADQTAPPLVPVIDAPAADPVTVAAPAEAKSKLPLMAALAAGIFFITTRDNK